MDTKYAPAGRDSRTQLMDELIFIRNVEYIEKLINTLPYIGAILNEKRQVVFANDQLLEMLKLTTVEDLLGQRPGEMLHCVNAHREIGGCGTSENCSVCGAVNCILGAQKNGRKEQAECRILAKEQEQFVAYDFLVTTSPFQWQGHMYYVLSLADISSEKRRKAMERIFFHDVINKTGSMYGFIDLLKEEQDMDRIHQFINFLDTLNRDLTNEIVGQRDLTAAENGELRVSVSEHDSLEIIQNSIQQIAYHEVAKHKAILEDPGSESFILKTDGTLLRRVLMNMLKNALEATEVRGKVSVGCSQTHSTLSFWVHNDGIIPRENQLQIFQRSFSTKGVARGLGTYSMKLLGEQYLGGRVGFLSNEKSGTRFYIEFPANN